MKHFEGIAAASDAVMRFMFVSGSTLPDHIEERLMARCQTGSSPVDRIVDFTEAVFANREEAPVEALEIAAGAADVIIVNGYHQSLDDRAQGIQLALRRQSGEEAPSGGAWPDPADDPAPKDAWLPSEQPAEPAV